MAFIFPFLQPPRRYLLGILLLPPPRAKYDISLTKKIPAWVRYVYSFAGGKSFPHMPQFPTFPPPSLDHCSVVTAIDRIIMCGGLPILFPLSSPLDGAIPFLPNQKPPPFFPFPPHSNSPTIFRHPLAPMQSVLKYIYGSCKNQGIFRQMLGESIPRLLLLHPRLSFFLSSPSSSLPINSDVICR